MKSRFLKQSKPAGLMLTSLLDMFTIILIFLIVSFEAEDYEFELNESLTLPESSAKSVFKPAVNVAITPDALIVEGEKVAELDGGRFAPELYEQDQIPAVVEVLGERFDTIIGDNQMLDPAEEDKAIILVQADRNLDYSTLYLVLRSASQAGFVKYRLAIMKK